MSLVILESPYAGDVRTNIAYAYRAMKDLLAKGHSPIASHLLYTQFLDDNIDTERKAGIKAGLDWAYVADFAAFYVDNGWSKGMIKALGFYQEIKKPFMLCTLDGPSPIPLLNVMLLFSSPAEHKMGYSKSAKIIWEEYLNEFNPEIAPEPISEAYYTRAADPRDK